MTERTNEGIFNFTNPARGLFVNVITPRAYQENGKAKGEAKYDLTVFFAPDHADFAALKARAVAVAKAVWPGRDIAADYKNGEIRMPWIMGEKWLDRQLKKLQKKGKEYAGQYDFLKGNVLLKTGSKYRPGLAVINSGKVIDLEDSTIAVHKGKFYSGVELLVQVNLVAYDAKKEDDKDGITAYVNKVLSVNKGEKIKIGNSQSAAEVFAGYVGTVTNVDPTAGADLDDEIPF